MLAVYLMLLSGQLAGLQLKDAIETLRQDGLNVVYSSRLVRPEMHVTEEPEATSPQRVLEELLAPHGLDVRRGPKGTWIVIRAEPETKTEPGERATAAAMFVLPHFYQEVEVNARTELGLVGLGATPVDVGVTKDVAGSTDNPFRALDTLPGVAATNEFGSRLSVRGGAPEQNLIVVDGVELYNPFRLHGVASALHPETLSRMELATSGFGVRYGDRLSSVIEVETRRGDETRYLSGALDLSATDANLVLEGKLPGGARGSWLLSGRRTYYDLIVESAVDGQFPAFSDLQTRWSWRPRDGQELSFTGLFGHEDMRLRPDQLDAADRRVSDEDFEIGGRSRTKLIALNFDTTLGGRARSKTTLSLHTFSDSLDLSGHLRTTALESPAGNRLNEVLFSRGLDLQDKALRQSFFIDGDGRHALSFGLEAHVLDTTWRYNVGDLRSESDPTATTIGLDSLGLPGVSLPERLDSEVDSTRSALWVEDRIQWNDRFTLVPGLRLDTSTLNRRTSLSPRLQASYRFRPKTRFRVEAGVYTQAPGYEKLFMADEFVDLSDRREREGLPNDRAFVASFGIDQELNASTRFRFDAYHKRYTRLVIGRLETEAERLARIGEYAFPVELQDQIPTDTLTTVRPASDGRGVASGLDASIQRTTDSWLNGWVSYSFLIADQRAHGRRFPFDYDATHRASFVARARLTPAMALSFTGRVATGFPRTPATDVRVAATRDESGRLVPLRDDLGQLIFTPDFGGTENLNSARRPTFGRLDVRFAYRTGGGEGRFTWYLEILNLLDRRNTLIVEPRVRFKDGVPRIAEETVGSLPRVPSFGLRFRF